MRQLADILCNKLLQNKNIWLWGAVSLLVLYLSPLFIFGGNLQFLVFDNLDSNVVWFKTLAESGKIFAANDAVIPNIMNGLPRSCYGSEFNIILWLYYFFTPLQAYIINESIIHAVAFVSMYIFLDRYLFKNDSAYKYIYVNAGALYFAILPFWPSGGLSIPIMPLVTYVLLRIEEGRDSWRSWLLLALLPLYSDFVLVYFFYFFLAGIYFLRKSIITRRFNRRLLFALVFTVALFLISDYRLVAQMFFENGFVSNRTEYYSLINKSFLDAYRSSLLEFLDGVPHAMGVQVGLLLPLALFTLLLLPVKKKLSTRDSLIFASLFIVSYFAGVWDIVLKQIYTLPLIMIILLALLMQNRSRLLPALLLAQVFLAFWFGFSFYEGWRAVFELFPGMEMFNFSRFFFMTEMLWAVIAAVVIKEILIKLNFSVFMIAVIVIVQFCISLNASFFTTKISLYQLPFNKYYAKKQFSEIEEYIGKPKESYRVVSLGIEPAVAQYNGFYTLDGYMVNYPLAYKHEFRKIIGKYIDSDKYYKDLFDGWGSKAYLFDNGVQYAYYNEFAIKSMHNKVYNNLELNVSQVSKMGGQYLFSAQAIEDPQKYGLFFLKTFTDPDSLWSVSLYKVEQFEKN